MSRALVAAALLVALYFVLGALGAAEHASAIAGMPRAVWSLPAFALYEAAHLGAIVVGPLLAIAAIADRVCSRGRRVKPPLR